MEKKILITGASGLVGTRLTELLVDQGYEVCHLGRSKKSGKIKSFVWNIETGAFDKSALAGVTSIIHLAGAGVADKRWTKKRKEEILQSRIKSTALLFDVLKNTAHGVESIVSASAIGYYSFSESDEVFTEDAESGNGFLADVTKHWEHEVDKFNLLNLRTVKLRIGIVLSDEGGALVQMAMPIKLGVGSPLATGKQFLSWIHIDDLCLMFIKAIEDTRMRGAFNATTEWASNKELTAAIAKVVHKPIWLPNVPAFMLRLIVGEMADMIINGSKVTSQKIQQLGFIPKYPSLQSALINLLHK
jgi:uncharacterized protein (TIGR01777 family)